MGKNLAATHRDHDFQSIAMLQKGGSVLAPGDNLAIQFHGDTLACQIKAIKQCGDIKGAIKTTNFAVDGYGYHLTAQIQ
jgi:hypothetical protein